VSAWCFENDDDHSAAGCLRFASCRLRRVEESSAKTDMRRVVGRKSIEDDRKRKSEGELTKCLAPLTDYSGVVSLVTKRRWSRRAKGSWSGYRLVATASIT